MWYLHVSTSSSELWVLESGLVCTLHKSKDKDLVRPILKGFPSLLLNLLQPSPYLLWRERDFHFICFVKPHKNQQEDYTKTHASNYLFIIFCVSLNLLLLCDWLMLPRPLACLLQSIMLRTKGKRENPIFATQMEKVSWKVGANLLLFNFNCELEK